MKLRSYFQLSLPFILAPIFSAAQAPFNTKEYVDIGNIKASVLVHGELWTDPSTYDPACEFPKNSGKHANFSGAIWASAYDNTVLHVSAQTYRQDGNDYWPGPLDAHDTLTYTSSESWAKIWKVNKSDIDNFKTLSTHSISNTPASILEWPAKNNPNAKGNQGVPLTITDDMAPFVDVNQDGNYDALSGDYPDIKGDQALWWIFSDNGPAHTNSKGVPLKIEIHAMAYASKKNSAVDNIIFYEYTVHNKSAINYRDFRIGLWDDADLGYYLDDYIGFDSARRLGYIYNGALTDGNGSGVSYGASPPVCGITLIEIPGDNSSTKVPVGTFTYYNNDQSQFGNPQIDTEYNNYLRSAFRYGTHLKNDFHGYGINSSGIGNGPNANYVFPGDPSDTSQWSECSSTNPPGDRRMIFATNNYLFNAGTSTKFIFALVVSDTAKSNVCGRINLTGIKAAADTAWNTYKTLSVPAIQAVNSRLQLYPNPVNEKVYFEIPQYSNQIAVVRVYDELGRMMPVTSSSQPNGKVEVNTGILTTGIYNIICNTGNATYTGRFVKK